MPRKIAEPADVFSYYFSHGLNKEKTLKTFHLSGSKKSPDYPNIWAAYKYQHPNEYEYAKEVYFEYKNINQRSIIDQIYEIAQDPSNRAVQLRALELLNSILTSSNERYLTKANKLVIEVVGDTDSKEENNV